MKKICFVTSSLGLGGAERMVSNLANHFSSQSYQVFIVTFFDKREYEIDGKIQVLNISTKNKLKRIIKLRKLIKDIDPNVIFSFLFNQQVILATTFTKYRKRTALTIRNNPKNTQKSLRFQEYFLKKAKLVIFQNSGQKNCFSNLNVNKCLVVPNFYNDNFLNSNRTYNSKCSNLICVGRLEPEKNHEGLIRAFSKLPQKDLKLTIVGSGSLENRLKLLISDLQLTDRVILVPFTKNVKEYLDQSDLFVFTSFSEGMPNALMEALASGIPCISSDCDFGPADLIKEGKTGYLYPPFDENALLKVMTEAIVLYPQSVKYGKASVSFMKEHFSKNVVCDLWEEAITKVINN